MPRTERPVQGTQPQSYKIPPRVPHTQRTSAVFLNNPPQRQGGQLSRRDLKNLVRNLGAASRPSQRNLALKTFKALCTDGDAASLASIAAGAIPPLVQLLGSGSAAQVQADASSALMDLALNAEIAATIAAAGAIPLLVQLMLGSGTVPGVIGLENAIGTLKFLAENAEAAVQVIAAGFIPALVHLLVRGSLTEVLVNAAGALWSLIQKDDDQKHENIDAIAAAGAIPPLVRLLGPGSDEATSSAAAYTLQALGHSNDPNRAAIAAASASANLLREMAGLSFD
ncbi:hypothetical protein FOA52_013107 [Chlamydomonas sp. UWO 241]|nr:hypothetical protein FOA52_013107 [Chlamydomonas sp. UWO 241]